MPELLRLESLVVLSAFDGAGAIVRLSQPAKRNALSTGALADIEAAFTFLQKRDPPVRVAVLEGEGRSFCAGADLREPGRPLPAQPLSTKALSQHLRSWRQDLQLGRRAMQAIEDLEALTICAAHGHAIGGGWCLSLACDLTVASADTQFRMPEVDIGLPLTWASTPRLARAVGLSRAKEIIALGMTYSAAEALQMGAVTRVEATEAAMRARVMELAQTAVSKDPLAMHMIQTQFKGLQRASFMGDVSEADGDLLMLPLLVKQLARI